MFPFVRGLGVLVVLIAGVSCAARAPVDEIRADVVIYGSTSAGVVAAIHARELGLEVVVVGPDEHLGGLSASGLGWTDSGDRTVIGGRSREFYRRIKQHYDQPEAWRQQAAEDCSRYRRDEDAMWVFEPHVAERVFEEWVAEVGVPVHRGRWLDRERGVEIMDRRVARIRMRSGETYAARVFIDASYEGDLMAAAGVSYRVGREGNDEYGETLNGVQTANATKHQFRNRVSPYVVAGDPSSGLLPHVHDNGPGREGSADGKVQAYNYRLCLTDHPDNRVPFPQPEAYDPGDYELLLRDLQAGSRHVFGKFDPIPNRKTDTNNSGSFSTDAIGLNHDYPEASDERRAEILAEHRRYQQGYYWFLSHDPRVPDDVRERICHWGLAADEFVDSGHWPHQIYVRESRRMVGAFVMTERHVRRLAETPTPVGMGSYNMDSHHVQRYVVKDPAGDYVRNEGDVQVSPGGAYPISYDALTPLRGECTNLLVPVCLSSTHIAYGSIRMEPVFMLLGHAVATAAALAIEQGVAVQDIDRTCLQERLLEEGQVLTSTGDRENPARGIELRELPGLVSDDADAAFDGRWAFSSSVAPYLGTGYRHDGNTAKGESFARFEVQLPSTGSWELRLAYTPHPNRARQVPVTITNGALRQTIRVNQTRPPEHKGTFHVLGVFDLRDPVLKVEVANRGTDGYVVVDGIQCLPVDRPPESG